MDSYAEQRAQMAIYDLVNSENVRAFEIARAVDQANSGGGDKESGAGGCVQGDESNAAACQSGHHRIRRSHERLESNGHLEEGSTPPLLSDLLLHLRLGDIVARARLLSSPSRSGGEILQSWIEGLCWIAALLRPRTFFAGRVTDFWFGSLPLGGEGRGGGFLGGSNPFSARAIVSTTPWIFSSSSWLRKRMMLKP
jgi:hypothetical protein